MAEKQRETEPHEYPAGCAFKSLQDIAGKRVTVMGLGLNGGGEASVRFFLKHGAYVTVTDMKTPAQLQPTIDALTPESLAYPDKLRYVLGKHEIADFADADVVIKNPGVKFENNAYLAAAKSIETDVSVFLRFTQAPIIAVTGSKGKSSTVSAIHYGLCAAGFEAFLGGNITVSPLTFLDKTDGTTPVVLELSSWQLADLRGRRLLKPHVAVLTKIVPDHQNWYGSMEKYVADKKLIYADQDASCWTVCAADDEWGDAFAAETNGTVLRYGGGKLPAAECGAWIGKNGKGYVRLPAARFSGGRFADGEPHEVLDTLAVPGSHMKTNALNAALVMSLLGVAPEQTETILARWPGIQHRLEYFHTWQLPGAKGRSVKFYNDSAATVPEAAAAASQAFGKPVHLLCGGTDKNLDFLPLARTLRSQPPASVYALAGTGTDKLLPLLKASDIRYEGPFESLAQLLSALKRNLQQTAASGTDREQIVVFSPGATSFGMFSNEFDRGCRFKNAVAELFG
ncbi:UDP-N-acetylmuramoyl-L-alanine--D-glutamate ligase [Treponema brennaborense]|uniref:UDP-N-acetylmuramoylalanine--D-glutamate ligase n=1 Tax=Treponema brennaborense (strain DSM 12168 / CIP 105900 / DD5/3) TaxID=906968 RepID=F4LIZ2_TREBD|nr:UDP-N-acetylmuramoyl-L-alanine--D-glutamate ligase [Treponema brennaborense]AEE17301.1 UDP-N-acetylmuramoylalanine/D-glutamate ligase [Treponema brennaborense DSM 12168]